MTGRPTDVGRRLMYAERVEKLQSLLAAERGCAVFGPGPNLVYFTGFAEGPQERLFLWLVPPEGPPRWVVPALYEHEVTRLAEAEQMAVWHDSEGSQGALMALVTEVLRAGAQRFYLDDWLLAPAVLAVQRAASRQFAPAAGQPPDDDDLFSPVQPLTAQLRAIKGQQELEAIRSACSLADQVFERLVQTRFKGESELALARRIEELALSLGADGMFFPPIVASGPNSALPHHRPTKRAVEPGDVVVLDFGCRLGPYGSDITRTVVCGKPSDEVREVYDVVHAAQEEGVAASRPGVACEAVDHASRIVIERAGYGPYFTHRTGHGIGLEAHEPPFLVKGDRTPLAAGMVHSVEPGIYLPERFGVRIEDLVVVEPGGTTRLNQVSRELLVVD